VDSGWWCGGVIQDESVIVSSYRFVDVVVEDRDDFVGVNQQLD
jgi:hypothetical protein